MPKRVAAALSVVLIISAGLPGAAYAQQPFGARIVALGGAGTALEGAVDLRANPAAWSTLDRTGVALGAAQLYGLPELRSASALAHADLFGTAAAAGFQTIGFELYRESTLVLAIARAFRPGTHRSVHVGIRLEETFVRIRNYGGTAVPTLSAGVLIPVSPLALVAASADNLVVLKPSARPDVQRTLAIGASYTPGPLFVVTTDILKEVRSPPSLRIGIETKPVPSIALRGGLTTEPPRLACGFGLRAGPFEIDAAAERHHALGWSPALTLQVRW